MQSLGRKLQLQGGNDNFMHSVHVYLSQLLYILAIAWKI